MYADRPMQNFESVDLDGSAIKILNIDYTLQACSDGGHQQRLCAPCRGRRQLLTD